MAWQDVLPALPLARGVPVVDSRGRRDIVLRLDCNGDPELSGIGTEDGGLWRIDLDAPQGFGYALRLLCKPTPSSRHYDVEWAQIIDRHLCGLTTHEDRRALASALAEAAK